MVPLAQQAGSTLDPTGPDGKKICSYWKLNLVVSVTCYGIKYVRKTKINIVAIRTKNLSFAKLYIKQN